MRGLLLQTTSGQLLPAQGTANGDTATLDLSAGVTLSVSEIQIGAVEIDDGDGATRLNIKADGVAVSGAPNDGALLIAGSDGTNVRHLGMTATNEAKVVTPNRSDWKVKQIDTGGVIDTPIAGPAQAVPDGYGVLVQADPGNTQPVQVGSVGETGAAGTRWVLQPGDTLPITLKISNMNQIEARSVLGTNEIVNLISEV